MAERDPIDDTIVESATTPNETPAEKIKRQRDEKLLTQGRKIFRSIAASQEFYREQALEDHKFRIGTWGKKSYQWPAGVQEDREADQLPVLTINRAPAFIRQVTNQSRQARLRIHVSPVDDKGDPKVAEVFQGLIRNIETDSFADRAYNTGSDQQAEHGLGFITIVREWRNQKDFAQRLRIKQETNPFRIYVGHAEEPDWSDADDTFKVTDLDKESFKERFNEDPPDPSTLSQFEGTGDQSGDWFPNGKVRVATWYHREGKGAKVRKARLSDGTIINYPDADQIAKLKELGVTIDRDRWVQPKVLMQRTITATKIYEESEWSSEYQPHIPVVGEALELEGVKDFRGIIRDSKDAGRAYNVQVTGLVTAVGQGLKAPVIGVVGQFGKPDSKMRKAWENASRRPTAFLEYELVDIDGKPAPRPERNNFDPPLEGQVLAIRQADEDYKTTAGFHDASFGERGPQESGKAIKFRQDQDTLGSSHYLDNLRFALCSVGRQLIQHIRVVYDAPTVLRITGNDDRQKKVLVFSGADKDPRLPKYQATDPNTSQPMPYTPPEGVDLENIFDLSAGEFDVEVTASPDQGTRRQENLEIIISLFSKFPPEISIKFLDLIFLLMDVPQARQMAERVKKLVPEAQDDTEGGGKPPVDPRMVAQMQQMHQQLTEAMKALQAAQLEIKTERGKIQSQMLSKREEIQSRERIEHNKILAGLLEKRIDITGEKALLLLNAEIDRLTLLQEQTHEAGLKSIELMEGDAERELERQLAVLDATLSQQEPAAPEPAAGA